MFEYDGGIQDAGGGMLTAAAAASHPAVAALLGIGTAGVAGGVVAMAWSVHVRQFRLAEQLARRQLIVTEQATARTDAESMAQAAVEEAAARVSAGQPNGAGTVAPVIIEGPDTVVAGEQARYRVRPAANRAVVGWAAGGGSLAQAPDPSHPDELLLVADRPGDLTVTVRVREGMMERRGTKPVTAVPQAAPPAPPLTLGLFLQGWGLVVVAVLVTGFAGALVALGSLTSADFIALVAPLIALLAVIAVARGAGDTSPGSDRGR
jgi:hypothetical protein